MVKLDQITTGTGDCGMTSLADGTRVAKNDPRVDAFGTVDELNCLLGVVLTEDLPSGMAEELRRIQNDLFDLGADIASPSSPEEPILRIDERCVQRLERAFEAVNAGLDPLESFILPGGTRTAAQLHLARAVARRAERKIFSFYGKTIKERPPEEMPNPLTTYLNRLSDLLFVYARLCNKRGCGDTLWVPGKTR